MLIIRLLQLFKGRLLITFYLFLIPFVLLSENTKVSRRKSAAPFILPEPKVLPSLQEGLGESFFPLFRGDKRGASGASEALRLTLLTSSAMH